MHGKEMMKDFSENEKTTDNLPAGGLLAISRNRKISWYSYVPSCLLYLSPILSFTDLQDG